MASQGETKLVLRTSDANLTRVRRYDVVSRKTGTVLGFIVRWTPQDNRPVEWDAFPIRGHMSPEHKHYGTFTTRREAVSEVWIMSDAK